MPQLDRQTIQDALLLSLVNVAATISILVRMSFCPAPNRHTAKGLALPSSIDMVMVMSYGFPAHHGGPLLYAQRRGLSEVCTVSIVPASHPWPQVVARLDELFGSLGIDALRPTEQLRSFASANKQFYTAEVGELPAPVSSKYTYWFAHSHLLLSLTWQDGAPDDAGSASPCSRGASGGWARRMKRPTP